MTAIALGCSHTAGVGIDLKDCYVSVLSQLLNCEIKNLGIPGGNATDLLLNLTRELKKYQPEFVIAQWPNPIRRTMWHGKQSHRENIHNASPIFQQLLKVSEENFYQPWIQCIVVADTLCELAQVPCLHIMIEDVEPQYHRALNEYNIVLHVDRKLPNETWLMDSAASDKLHHSARCHKQWAQRIFGLLNEPTTR